MKFFHLYVCNFRLKNFMYICRNLAPKVRFSAKVLANQIIMEKYNVLLGYLQKQKQIILKLYSGIKSIDLSVYENQYVFALKSQQLYTAMEDLLKSIAGTFENNISDFSRYHLELLKVMSSDIPGIRPALLNDQSYSILDRLRSFRHFIRHGYDYDLDKDELILLQNKLNVSFDSVISDVNDFELFINKLVNESE